MKLTVIKENCIDCGACSELFKGMPDSAFEGIDIPEWAESCFRAGKVALLKGCGGTDAIVIEDEPTVEE